MFGSYFLLVFVLRVIKMHSNSSNLSVFMYGVLIQKKVWDSLSLWWFLLRVKLKYSTILNPFSLLQILPSFSLAFLSHMRTGWLLRYYVPRTSLLVLWKWRWWWSGWADYYSRYAYYFDATASHTLRVCETLQKSILTMMRVLPGRRRVCKVDQNLQQLQTYVSVWCKRTLLFSLGFPLTTI